MIAGFSLLNVLVILPLAGALGALASGRMAKRVALVAAWLTLLCAGAVVALFAGGDGSEPGGFRFVNALPLLPAYGVNYIVGIDGLGAAMVLMSALVLMCAVQAAPEPDLRPGLFYGCLMFIGAGAIGAFVSVDVIVFYAFHELALVPTFLLIGIWGTGNRTLAAWRSAIYLGVGSFVLLIGLMALYLGLPAESRTFDLRVLLSAPEPGALLSPEFQGPVFLLLLAGFGTLVSLFPLHTWAPAAYASAPPSAAMLHAGVLKKFGLFGLLRIAVPLLPLGFQQYGWLLVILLAGNLLFVGLATVAQRQLDYTLGYSSVMHMGYIFLGIAAFNTTAFAGAAFLMVAHGLSVALLFLLSGEVRQRTGTLTYGEVGGLATRYPRLGFAFGLAVFASIGLPGFANFAGELLVFFGAFGAGPAAEGGSMIFDPIRIVTAIGLFGVLLSAVYMLRAYRSLFMGEPLGIGSEHGDLAGGARGAAILLAAALLVFGFVPGLLTGLFEYGGAGLFMAGGAR